MELSLYTPFNPSSESGQAPSKGELIRRRDESGMFAARLAAVPVREEQEAHVRATAQRVVTHRLQDTAKQMILDHFERWFLVEGSRYKVKREALAGYCNLYMVKKLDLPADVYARVKKVSVASVYRWQQGLGDAACPSIRQSPDRTGSGRQAAPLIGAESVNLKGFLMPFKSGLNEIQQRVVLSYFLSQEQMKTATIYHNLERSGHGGGVSYSAVYRYLNNIETYNKDIVIYARKGPTAYANLVQSYIERDWSELAPDDMWIADGHKLDIAFRHPRTGKAARATTVVFLDARSRRVVGFSLHWTETTDSALQALSMGLALSGTPKYILFDNGTAFKNHRMLGEDLDTVKVRGVLDHFGIQPVWSIPGNPRSKPVERFFGTVKDQFSRLWPTFTGGHPFWKPEQLEHLVKAGELPELGEAFRFLARYFDQYNASSHTAHSKHYETGKHGTPNQVYETVQHQRHALETLKVCMRKAFTGSCQRNGFLVAKVWYYNMQYTPKLVGNGKKYIIYLNDFDGSSVDVHDDRDRYLFTAWPLDRVSPLAQFDDDKREQLREAVHRQRVNLKDVKNSVGALAAQLPDEALVERLLASVEVKELEVQEAINSQPVNDKLDEHPSGEVNRHLYGDEYEPMDLDE